jgi:hypothetical protein
VLQALKKEVQEQNVKPLIQTTLNDVGIPVYVYTTFKKGVAAEEQA